MKYLRYGKWDLQTTRICSPGRQQGILHGRMYDERAEECYRNALAQEIAMKNLENPFSHALIHTRSPSAPARACLCTVDIQKYTREHIHWNRATHKIMNVCAHINMQLSYEPVFVERFGNLFCKQTNLQEKGKKKNLNGGVQK